MEPYETFSVGQDGGNNDAVGFCRGPSDTDPTKFSTHSQGFVVDINPLRNPSRENDARRWPPGSDAFAPRTEDQPGRIGPTSAAVAMVPRRGWFWGGFRRQIDCMHFEKVTLGGRSGPLSAPCVAESPRYRE